MILSGRDIQWYIDTGKLGVSDITPEQFRENGIDLILEDIMFYDGVPQKHPKSFIPLKFYLGCTREILCLPDDLMAFVELRSTWARSGLFLPPTIVDAGFKGNLTLEILPLTNISIPYGQRFAHLIFAKMTSHGSQYQGKYLGQRGITEAILDESAPRPN